MASIKLDMRRTYRMLGNRAQDENLQRFLAQTDIHGAPFVALDDDTNRIKASRELGKANTRADIAGALAPLAEAVALKGKAGQAVRALARRLHEKLKSERKAVGGPGRKGRKAVRIRVRGERISLSPETKPGVDSGALLRSLVRRANVKVFRVGFQVRPAPGQAGKFWRFNAGSKRNDWQPARHFSGLSDQFLADADDVLAIEARDQVVRQISESQRALLRAGDRGVAERVGRVAGDLLARRGDNFDRAREVARDAIAGKLAAYGRGELVSFGRGDSRRTFNLSGGEP